MDGAVKQLLSGLVGLVLCSSAWSEVPIERPAMKEGDTWTVRTTSEKAPSAWNQTHNEITVTRVTSSTIFLSVKASGSTQPPRELFVGADWARLRDVNGKETVVNRPVVFPLSQGKSWDVAYSEDNPNKNHKSEKFNTHFTVVGLETVEVPAGKFQAWKIEADGRWQAELAPGQNVVQSAQSGQSGATLVTQVQNTTARETTGRLYKAYWYVPEMKRWVKSVEEDYSSGGVRNARYTEELESFKAGGAKGE
jgi:hypothetical protein